MKKLLVPTDFTPVADNALNYAVNLAKAAEAQVVALHVVSSQSKIAKAKAQVEELAQKTSTSSGIPVDGVVRVGSIFDTIGNTAKEVGAELAVMGTHGLKGLQYLTGSHALKVITNAATPFIVVQEKPAPEEIGHILMPIDLNKETKQVLKLAAELAKLFRAKIHLFSIRQTDPFHKKSLNRNIGYAKEFFTEQKVRFSITVPEDTGNSFSADVVKYAQEIEADLITIVNFTEDHLFNMFGATYEQQLITNDAQVPVLIVNRKNFQNFEVSQGMPASW